jgi:hypothetical protein
MTNLWTRLENQTQGWLALDRQGLVDAIWHDYVLVRFARSGEARALELLYPYLNHAERGGKAMQAIRAAGRVFEGCGPEAVRDLDYFTRNTDCFIRDRAVLVVGATVHGFATKIVLDTLAPYLNNRNQFAQRCALKALSRAAAGSADEQVLAEILRVAETSRIRQNELDFAIARVFGGHPTEETYRMVARPDAPSGHMENDMAVGVLMRGCDDDWYERVCKEYFLGPRILKGDVREDSWARVAARAGMEGLCHASPGSGMEVLKRIIGVATNKMCCNALLACLPPCFDGADTDANLNALLELLGTDADVQVQRIGALCLGHLMYGTEDVRAAECLKELCRARSGSVRAAAIEAFGLVLRSSCDEEGRAMSLTMAKEPETARAAVRALGHLFHGSGRYDVFDDLRRMAAVFREESRGRRHHSRPLRECYEAVGLVYQGTGSVEPVDFLLDAVVISPVQWCPYRWAAGRALIRTEFSETALARTRIDI